MDEPRFHLRVAEDFLIQARKALNAGITSLSALSLVLAVENAVLSFISCFEPPLTTEDIVVELKFLIEEHLSIFKDFKNYIEEFVETSQFIIYTYRDLLIHGDPTTNRVPSEVLSLEELLDLVDRAERIADIAEKLVNMCRNIRRSE